MSLAREKLFSLPPSRPVWPLAPGPGVLVFVFFCSAGEAVILRTGTVRVFFVCLADEAFIRRIACLLRLLGVKRSFSCKADGFRVRFRDGVSLPTEVAPPLFFTQILTGEWQSSRARDVFDALSCRTYVKVS